MNTLSEDPSSEQTTNGHVSGIPSAYSQHQEHGQPQSTTFSFQLIRQKTVLNLMPPKKVGKAPGVWKSIKAIILASWLNTLLICIPISWALHFALPASFANRDTLIFVFSFLSIIPLAKLLAFATEEISLRVGQTLAGLINATLGNAVELIVAIIATAKCQLRIVQLSLVGSILSNLLLVLGMCFFAGGLKYSEQGFGASATQLNSSLLAISVFAVLLPAAFHLAADPQLSDADEGHDILAVSHGVAIILLFIYAAYLAFQLYSHSALYDDTSIPTTKYQSPKFYVPRQMKWHHSAPKNKDGASDVENKGDSFSNRNGSSTASPTSSPQPITRRNTALHIQDPSSLSGADKDLHVRVPKTEEEKEDEEEEPKTSFPITVGLLVVVAVLVAVTAEWLVDSIDGLTDGGHISKEFVGIILLPIVGNAAEHVTAVTVSVKDKLNLSLGVAVGSSIQIALFVIPFIVTLAWILGKPLTLLFDPFESITLFLAVLIVNYAVQDGKSNWLEGFILMCLYFILALIFWFYPGSDPSGVLELCH